MNQLKYLILSLVLVGKCFSCGQNELRLPPIELKKCANLDELGPAFIQLITNNNDQITQDQVCRLLTGASLGIKNGFVSNAIQLHQFVVNLHRGWAAIMYGLEWCADNGIEPGNLYDFFAYISQFDKEHLPYPQTFIYYDGKFHYKLEIRNWAQSQSLIKLVGNLSLIQPQTYSTSEDSDLDDRESVYSIASTPYSVASTPFSIVPRAAPDQETMSVKSDWSIVGRAQQITTEVKAPNRTFVPNNFSSSVPKNYVPESGSKPNIPDSDASELGNPVVLIPQSEMPYPKEFAKIGMVMLPDGRSYMSVIQEGKDGPVFVPPWQPNYTALPAPNTPEVSLSGSVPTKPGNKKKSSQRSILPPGRVTTVPTNSAKSIQSQSKQPKQFNRNWNGYNNNWRNN